MLWLGLYETLASTLSCLVEAWLNLALVRGNAVWSDEKHFFNFLNVGFTGGILLPSHGRQKAVAEGIV